MLLASPTPWTKLLSHRFDDVSDEYGPNSHEVVCAFEALDEIDWLAHAGEPLEDLRVSVVQSWEDALTILHKARGRGRYNVMGILQAPCTRIAQVYERFPERDLSWKGAREEAKRYAILDGVPRSRPWEDRELMFEHLYEYVSMLISEIIASPEASCTYFREQLEWFHIGRFPCGWDGDWPAGRMRVF
jgi:hypothetical protein